MVINREYHNHNVTLSVYPHTTPEEQIKDRMEEDSVSISLVT